MSPESIAALFRGQVKCCLYSDEMDCSLWPEEREAVLSASSKRREEFLRGRAAARHAIHELGGGKPAIPREANGMPVWPAGFIGSISHCEGCCGAVVAREGEARCIGFDVERVDGFPNDAGDLIFCRAEVREAKQLFISNPEALLFSAKEAFYKCFFPIEQTFLDFRDVTIIFGKKDDDTQRGEFSVTVHSMAVDSGKFFGKWLISGGLVFTGVSLVR